MLTSLFAKGWRRAMSVNVGIFLTARATIPVMKAQRSAAILHTACDDNPLMPHDVPKEAAALGLTRRMAREQGPHGIEVNIPAPGCTSSEGMMANATQARRDRQKSTGEEVVRHGHDTRRRDGGCAAAVRLGSKRHHQPDASIERQGDPALILVGIGASLPGPDGAAPKASCQAAAAALDALPGLRLRALSRWWASAPIPPMPGAPWFVNGVARLEGRADPTALLAALHGIEARFARARPFPNAPRTLDLDLLDIDGLQIGSPGLVLPHPRMQLREFVLRPLLEVAPGWRHPVLGGAAALLAALLPQALHPL